MLSHDRCRIMRGLYVLNNGGTKEDRAGIVFSLFEISALLPVEKILHVYRSCQRGEGG